MRTADKLNHLWGMVKSPRIVPRAQVVSLVLRSVVTQEEMTVLAINDFGKDSQPLAPYGR